MKVRYLTLALIFSFLITNTSICHSAMAQRPAKNKQRVSGVDRWYVFVSPDGDFTLSFPKRPKQEPDAPGPVTPIKSYGVSIHKGMRFSINSQGSFGVPNPQLANEWNDRYEKRAPF